MKLDAYEFDSRPHREKVFNKENQSVKSQVGMMLFFFMLTICYERCQATYKVN